MEVQNLQFFSFIDLYLSHPYFHFPGGYDKLQC